MAFYSAQYEHIKGDTAKWYSSLYRRKRGFNNGLLLRLNLRIGWKKVDPYQLDTKNFMTHS